MMDAATRLREGLDRGQVPGLTVVGNPDVNVVAFMARNPKVGAAGRPPRSGSDYQGRGEKQLLP